MDDVTMDLSRGFFHFVSSLSWWIKVPIGVAAFIAAVSTIQPIRGTNDFYFSLPGFCALVVGLFFLIMPLMDFVGRRILMLG